MIHSIYKKIISSIIVCLYSIVLFVPFFSFAQPPVQTETTGGGGGVGAAFVDCEIVSAEFSEFFGRRSGNFYDDDAPPIIKVRVETNSGCIGNDIIVTPYDHAAFGIISESDEVSVSDVQEETTFLDSIEQFSGDVVDAINNGTVHGPVNLWSSKKNTVPKNGVLELKMLAGENKCEALGALGTGALGSGWGTPDCYYHIKVYDTNGNELYSSRDKPKGELEYWCDVRCNTDWRAASNYEPTECRIRNAEFQPSGDKGSNWYSDTNQPKVKIIVNTKNCAGQKIQIGVAGRTANQFISALQDTTLTIENFLPKEFIVSESEKVILHMSVGNESGHCSENINLCQYYIVATPPQGITEFMPYATRFDTKNINNGLLEFTCPDCTYENDWRLLGYSDALNQNNVLITGETPNYEKGEACVNEEGTGLRPNCYAVLAPLSPDLLEVETGVDGDFTLGKYINIIVNIVIGVAGLLAVVMIIFGGVQYMTTDAIAGKSEAKGTITNAIIGLLIALGSFVILNTINPQLLKIDPDIDEISINVDEPPALKSDGTYATTDPLVGAVRHNTPWPIPAYNLKRLGANLPGNNISINKNECTRVGEDQCTSTYFNEETYDVIRARLQELQAACQGCSIVITGGSEFWLHKTHGPSFPVIDISILHNNYTSLEADDIKKLNQALSKKDVFPRDNQIYTVLPNFEALAEDPKEGTAHWHITLIPLTP